MLEVERKWLGRGAKTFLTRPIKSLRFTGRDIADCDYSEALIGTNLTFYESRRLTSESTQRLGSLLSDDFQKNGDIKRRITCSALGGPRLRAFVGATSSASSWVVRCGPIASNLAFCSSDSVP